MGGRGGGEWNVRARANGETREESRKRSVKDSQIWRTKKDSPLHCRCCEPRRAFAQLPRKRSVRVQLEKGRRCNWNFFRGNPTPTAQLQPPCFQVRFSRPLHCRPHTHVAWAPPAAEGRGGCSGIIGHTMLRGWIDVLADVKGRPFNGNIV